MLSSSQSDHVSSSPTEAVELISRNITDCGEPGINHVSLYLIYILYKEQSDMRSPQTAANERRLENAGTVTSQGGK
jgi:hypothetical protein